MYLSASLVLGPSSATFTSPCEVDNSLAVTVSDVASVASPSCLMSSAPVTVPSGATVFEVSYFMLLAASKPFKKSESINQLGICAVPSFDSLAFIAHALASAFCVSLHSGYCSTYLSAHCSDSGIALNIDSDSI